MNTISFSTFPQQGLSSANAQNRPPPPPPPKGEDLVKRLDADQNGSLSASEIEETRFGERIGDGFGDLDTDGDGSLSIAELDVGAQAARTEGGPDRGAGPGGSGGPGGPGGQGAGAAPSGIDAESLFQSLFEVLSDEDTTVSSDMSAYAEQLYTDMQVLLGRAA